MKKILAIAGYSTSAATVFTEQIKSLFSNTIDIKEYYIDDNGKNSVITADLLLVPSYDAFERMIKSIEMPCEIIFGNRTISRVGMEKISGIPKDTEVLLLDENLEMARQMASSLYQIGVRDLHLIPIAALEELHNKIVIAVGDGAYAADSRNHIINIGSSLLDISTIIDIGTRLKLGHILNRQNIRESYREIVTLNVGLAEVLGKTNRFESSLDILLQVMDDGVIGIESQGEVFSYNKNARRIMGLAFDSVIGGNGFELFPQIPFRHVIKNNKPVKEKLERINGYDVIVSVSPLFHSERLYGAVAVISRFSEKERKQHEIRAQLIGKGYKAKYEFADIVGVSPSLLKCKEIAARMAKSNSSILITGESGTGKEIFAQAIHNSSDRKAFQFVAVNCGALPESLLESELFGYEEGAFTGARKGGKPGLFELAHNGTLFLDEIGEMPLNLQMRLLRVLQEREVMHLGGDRLISVDIRLIAATNRNLKEMVKSGRFREDLYYRLNVLPLTIPPLRSRTEDIFPLIEEFTRSSGEAFELMDSVKQAFTSHSWKGNVRELRNYVEYIINLGIKKVDIVDLPFEFESGMGDSDLQDNKQLLEVIMKLQDSKKAKYLFVLEELAKSYCCNTRLGRRSIAQLAREKKLLVGEQEMRGIIKELEKHSMVEVLTGRSGTVITPLGMQVLETLKRAYGSKSV